MLFRQVIVGVIIVYLWFFLIFFWMTLAPYQNLNITLIAPSFHSSTSIRSSFHFIFHLIRCHLFLEEVSYMNHLPAGKAWPGRSSLD